MTLNDKTIFLLLPGTSILELKKHMPIENVLWASLNRFTPIERDFLKPYGKAFDLVWLSSSIRFEEEKENVFKLLNRGGDFYTSHELYLRYEHDFDMRKGNTILSSEGFGLCSLFCFLAVLISKKPKEIILIGADGKGTDNVYYNDSELSNENLNDRRTTILRDTQILNKIFWDCINIWYPPSSTQIFNTNKNSAYTIFNYKSLERVIHDIT